MLEKRYKAEKKQKLNVTGRRGWGGRGGEGGSKHFGRPIFIFSLQKIGFAP